MKRKCYSLTLSRTRRARESMMATSCKPQCFPNQRLSFRLLSLVMIITWLFSVTESGDVITFKGEVGGNVTIVCPAVWPFEFLYFQRGVEYVNGYHSRRNLTDSVLHPSWPNTRMGEDKKTIHMFNLNISHSGDYVCYVKYPKKEVISSTNVHLNVTAKYTKPEVKKNCDGLICMVTCSSYGGYPRNSMSWSVPGSQTVWKEVDSNVTDDPITMMMNIFSTAYFNCSKGELQHIRCSVGEVTSDMFSVCTPSPPPGNHVILIAISTLVAISITSTVLLLLCKCKKRRTGAVAIEVRQNWEMNGQKEEEVELNNKAS